jgi:chemotaxis protein CheX
LDAQVIDAFTRAAREVLLKEIGEPVELKQPRVQAGPIRLDDVVVVVPLAQQIEGAVVLALSSKTALQYLSFVLGEELTELDDIALSGIGELGNVLAGATASQLAAINYVTTIFPPTIHVGPGKLSLGSFPRLVFPVEIRFGKMDLHLAARITS